MPINPRDLIRDAQGRPQPPEWLTARLQRDNPGVGVFYTKASWAITEAWKETDPRRARIASGEMPAEYAFDICGYLPVTISLEEAPGYIAQFLRGYSDSEWTGIRHAVNRWNFAEDTGEDAETFQKVMAGVSDNMGKFVSSAGFMPSVDVSERAAPFAEPIAKNPETPDLSTVPNTPALTGRLAGIAKAREALKKKREATTIPSHDAAEDQVVASSLAATA